MSRSIRSLVLSVPALALALAAALVGPSAQAVTASQSYGRAAVGATNAARHAHGRTAVRTDRCMQRFAAAQAAQMAAQHRMFHQDISVPLRVCHLRSIGENVAVGFRTGRSVVRDGWMKSPPHRANLLHRSFRIVAVAARRGGGQWYTSQLLARR